MIKPYLIQRAQFRNINWKEGIDSIIKLDYMGSSEFEWGAVPKSLSRIRKDIDNYTYLNISLEGKEFTIFCKNSQKPEMEIVLQNLAEGKYRLKEHLNFKTYIKPATFDLVSQMKYGHETDFWWDIEYDFMFWKKTPEFENMFKEKIKSK